MFLQWAHFILQWEIIQQNILLELLSPKSMVWNLLDSWYFQDWVFNSDIFEGLTFSSSWDIRNLLLFPVCHWRWQHGGNWKVHRRCWEREGRSVFQSQHCHWAAAYPWTNHSLSGCSCPHMSTTGLGYTSTFYQRGHFGFPNDVGWAEMAYSWVQPCQTSANSWSSVEKNRLVLHPSYLLNILPDIHVGENQLFVSWT